MSDEKVTKAPAFDAEAAAKALAENPSAVNQLLTIMLMREARATAKEEADEKARATRASKRGQNSQHSREADMLRQMRCKHLKGGKKGPLSGRIDYAIAMHTFINNDKYIKCQLCGMKWKPEDTQEYLVRGGKKIKNHTNIGWIDAFRMQAQSTNTATMSEIPQDPKPREISSGSVLDGNDVTYTL